MFRYCPQPCKETARGGGGWIEGGDGKWSELFPFPQPVYGNIMGARFSSHGGGKDLESERVRARDMRKVKE